jgi:hypothetical protein
MSLVKARAAQHIEDIAPSPFFKTRVLAAIRDRAPITSMWPAEKMWRSARTIVASMCALVVILLALNLLAPKPVDITVATDNPRAGDSIERIVMDDSNSAPDDNLTSGQVLDTLFAQGDSYGID